MRRTFKDYELLKDMEQDPTWDMSITSNRMLARENVQRLYTHLEEDPSLGFDAILMIITMSDDKRTVFDLVGDFDYLTAQIRELLI